MNWLLGSDVIACYGAARKYAPASCIAADHLLPEDLQVGMRDQLPTWRM
jgi:hypothetical protein